MHTTTTTSDSQTISGTMQRRARTSTFGGLQLLVAFSFASAGWLKLSDAPDMVDTFATIGIGQWFRILIGTLAIADAIGLVLPRLAGLAARSLSGLLVGAIPIMAQVNVTSVQSLTTQAATKDTQ